MAFPRIPPLALFFIYITIRNINTVVAGLGCKIRNTPGSFNRKGTPMVITSTRNVMKMIRAFCIMATLCVSASMCAADKSPDSEKTLSLRDMLIDGRVLESIKIPKVPEVPALPCILSRDEMDKDFGTMLQENIIQQVHSRGPFAVRMALKQKAPIGRVALLVGGLVMLEKRKYDTEHEDRLPERRSTSGSTSGGCIIS